MPFGESAAEALAARNGAALQPYKYGGKEEVSLSSLTFLDFHARPYDPATLQFLTPDQHREKYIPFHSQLYCLANPINFTDPTGMTVVADLESQKNILNTVTAYEEQFVTFDENGLLNTSKLAECENMSENMSSLAALANSEIQYNFITTDKVIVQDPTSGTVIDNSYLGLTEMPGAENNSSPDGVVNIKVKNNRPDIDQAKTTAHEAYGHAYVYEKTRDAKKATHDKQIVDWDDQKKEFVVGDKNTLLKERIERVERNTKINYIFK